MTYYLDGTCKRDEITDSSCVRLLMWRDEYENTKPTDKVDSYELGELKAAVNVRIRIPAFLAVWYWKLKLKLVSV